MNLTKLFNAQRQLDEHIEKEHPRQAGEDRLAKKILALQVELGELANECPDVFKFWSNKVMNREKALEEYVDCLHFILSIGEETFDYYNKTPMPVKHEIHRLEEYENWRYEHITNIFNALFHTIGYFSDCITDCCLGSKSEVGEQYIEIIRGFFGLGELLGFTWDEVEAAYFDKNTINHQRQENNY